MARVVWGETGKQRRKECVDFVTQGDSKRAKALDQKVRQAVRRLKITSRIGRVVPEYGREDARELWVDPLRVLYQVKGNNCEVIWVAHGRQDLAAHYRPPDDNDS